MKPDSTARVYVEPSGRLIEPFGDPPGDVLILNQPLRERQVQMIQQAGLERIDTPNPPCLIIPDTLFSTAGVLRRFVEGAGGRNAVLGLSDSKFARNTTPVQPGVVRCDKHFRFEAVRFVSGGNEAPVDVICDPEERRLRISMPAAFDASDEGEIGLPRHPVITVHHWIHILWANVAATGAQRRQGSKAAAGARAAWAAVRARSFNRWCVMAKLSKIGRNCDIHPTALVEGSILEDNVSVGPFSRVLFSYLGRGATVGTGAQVEASFLGEDAVVCQGTTARVCVLYPKAVASQSIMQMSVLGRNAIAYAGSWTFDLNLQREVRVMLDGVWHGTGTRFVGSAYGHGCRVGGGAWLAQGRMIPNGAVVVGPPNLVISRVPQDLPQGVPLSNDHGTLRPLESRSVSEKS